MILYRLIDIKQEFEGRTVLDIDALSVEEGRIYALLGPNGAGKTTLLNIMAFLERPAAGRLYYRSREIRFAQNNLQALRREVVLVDQHPILFTTTVYKNVEFGLKVRKISKQERSRLIMEALELVGMTDFSQAPAHRLSGGETQRVALARALAVSPAVLLCDEPTSSVDTENQNIIVQILKDINERKNISILFTTHDNSQVSQLAHRKLQLSHGRLIE